MRIVTLAGTRTLSGEPPRSTAYYYADLERLKRKNSTEQNGISQTEERNDELSEYVEYNEVVNEGAAREVPPLRDRGRQWSLPEYHTPENARKIQEETYSTAGTFPMPEPKEKEPLLAELEVVGRLPLTQLESTSGVRRSRSWYLCCPNVADEEISRESSWRYSSLRPVTAPPVPGQNGLNVMVATQSSGHDDAATLRAERDALARALAAERQRSATAARAHDARLAELHGVIAELVRRRAADKQSRAIPEEEVSDECESTTQPAGELENDADRSRTEQNDTSSMLSPAELPTPQEPKLEQELPEDTTDTSTHEEHVRLEDPIELPTQEQTPDCDTSLNLSERDSELCLSTARCCQYARHTHTSAGDSCERDHGSNEETRVFTASPGRCESRQAKLATRVRIRRANDSEPADHLVNDESWCAGMAERLALDVCAAADLREAIVAAGDQASAAASAQVSLWRARCSRLEADVAVLRCALARATDTAHRLSCACAVQESSSVSLCCALRSADRALEVYDVLLALAETKPDDPQRGAAELVAAQTLRRLEQDPGVGEPLLSPGPWLHRAKQGGACGAWEDGAERRLREHAARLKADTVALRQLRPPPQLFSYYDADEEESSEVSKSVGVSMQEMEAAVMMQEALRVHEQQAAARAARLASHSPTHNTHTTTHTTHSNHGTHTRTHADTHNQREVRDHREGRERESGRHWLHARASETDL